MKHLRPFNESMSYDEKIALLKSRIDNRFLQSIEDIGTEYEDKGFEKRIHIIAKPKGVDLTERKDNIWIYSPVTGWADLNIKKDTKNYLIDIVLQYDIVYNFKYVHDDFKRGEINEINNDILHKLLKLYDNKIEYNIKRVSGIMLYPIK